ncbi:SDR family NAD(P)-dependent oxidoreductase [Arcanobacterium ihumii]|uniref:SDR family NAD(P)-dependent oxidoreductase n=1 Tax=Arcanobacterium ihumii TaxID=2138162 RepID=UPI000F51EBDB|nr:SDR family oxidoreductase [Arcanobacterium ihumii]
MAKRALVTGASTGIGAAIVRSLCASGYQVLATARREERLQELTDRCGANYVAADLTTDDGIAAVGEAIDTYGSIDVLVNCAGGALGMDTVVDGNVDDWRRMYEINVVGALRVTQLVLPHMKENGGDVVFISSTAGHGTYPGGAGYVAAKHAERQIPATLRLELVGFPVRIIDIAPGMVKTEEFTLNRLRGDVHATEKVYEGVEQPLVAEDIAEAVRWAVSLPPHVNIDSMIVRPVAQASNTLVARKK